MPQAGVYTPQAGVYTPQAGVYIAHHAWLDADHGPGAQHKVGHTGDLGARLHDSAYVTCFSAGWRFVATFEVDSKADAQRLEAAVLDCFAARRAPRHELVRATAAEIARVAAATAAALGIAVNHRAAPEYAARPRSDGPTETATRPSDRPLYAHLVVAAAAATPAAPPAATPPAQAAATECQQPDDDDIGDVGDVGVGDVSVGDVGVAPAAPAPLQLRDYQAAAVAACRRELAAADRTILQMACRCGKTPVAYTVALDYGRVLILVPGLALARQTALKFVGYGHPAADILVVGSDPRPIAGLAGASASAGATMTTDLADVRAFMGAGARRLVISTYQSSAVALAAAYDLTVFDECHRVCGGRAPRPFNLALLAPAVSRYLFMTATPAYGGEISMDDRAAFGGVAYRYYLREGIEAGHVNDFRLELVAAAPGAAAPGQIGAAMAQVDKLLVFCRDIGHATALALACAGADFECLLAHSRLPAGGAAAALQRFCAAGRAAIFTVRMLQEGVEIPPLVGVFFAAPRHSARDIIQSLCRPLNRAAGKPMSAVFLPVEFDAALAPDAAPNLKRFAAVLPVVDALLDEDPRLYEHLLDPRAVPYPISAAGAAGAAVCAGLRRAARGAAGARLMRAERVPWSRAYGELRRVVLECGRYPKTTDMYAVGEATVGLHAIYRRLADAHAAGALEPYQARLLEALPGWAPFGVEGPYPWRHCMAFLERWLERHGAPPMVEINKGGYVGLEATDMERLSGCLTCVNQQVFAGADGPVDRVPAAHAADLDRICGRFGLRWRKEFLPKALCAPARKAPSARPSAAGRKAAKAVVADDSRPTFIQEAFARFKQYYAAHGADGEYVKEWFPGYPRKHATQTRLDLIGSAALPPRRRDCATP